MTHMRKHAVNGHLTKQKTVADKPLVKCPLPCDYPTLYLTVSGAVTKNVYWCGFSWSLPTDSGLRVEACPWNWQAGWTYVDYSPSPFAPPSYIVRRKIGGTEFWIMSNHYTIPYANWKRSLTLFRNVLDTRIYFTWGTIYVVHYHLNELNIQPVSGTIGQPKRDKKVWLAYSTVTPYSSLNLILGVAEPVVNPTTQSYTFDTTTPSAFYNQKTINGITYKWEKGNGWPH